MKYTDILHKDQICWFDQFVTQVDSFILLPISTLCQNLIIEKECCLLPDYEGDTSTNLGTHSRNPHSFTNLNNSDSLTRKATLCTSSLVMGCLSSSIPKYLDLLCYSKAIFVYITIYLNFSMVKTISMFTNQLSNADRDRSINTKY